MLKEFLSAFLPPYDIYDLIFIIPTLLILWMACSLLRDAFADFQVSRFFAKNGVTAGVVKGYEKCEATNSTALSPMRSGSSTIFIPRFNASPEKYYILVESRNDDMLYIATYRIPYEDYKKAKKGDTVEISDDWDAISYEIVEQ